MHTYTPETGLLPSLSASQLHTTPGWFLALVAACVCLFVLALMGIRAVHALVHEVLLATISLAAYIAVALFGVMYSEYEAVLWSVEPNPLPAIKLWPYWISATLMLLVFVWSGIYLVTYVRKDPRRRRANVATATLALNLYVSLTIGVDSVCNALTWRLPGVNWLTETASGLFEFLLYVIFAYVVYTVVRVWSGRHRSVASTST